MACFIVPGTEAVVTAIAGKIIKNEEKKYEEVSLDGTSIEKVEKISLSRKVSWLTKLLAGGSALLAFEHFYHGEVVPFFPFLTAAANKNDAIEMLHEMGTTGVGMAVIVTAIWGGMLMVSSVVEKKAIAQAKAIKEEA